VSRDVRAARAALTAGLGELRDSLADLLAIAVRGDGGPRQNRNRAPVEPPRELPASRGARSPGGRPARGRLAAPERPTTPAQPTPPAQRPRSDSAADTAVLPINAADTVVLPVVPADEASKAGGATGYPDRPDPSDPASEVWGLIRRAQAGDAEAFGLLYDRYVDTVFRFVYFRVGNRQLAEDLTSDTFLRALRRISSFTWQGRDLGAWLVTIARNLVADHFKSGRYRLEVTTSDVLDADREDRGPEGSPEAAVVEHITNVTLLAAVKQLNPEQQECIVLRFLQGFSVAETAKAMGKNEGAIKALQYRAVRALARLLPEGFQP